MNLKHAYYDVKFVILSMITFGIMGKSSEIMPDDLLMSALVFLSSILNLFIVTITIFVRNLRCTTSL